MGNPPRCAGTVPRVRTRVLREGFVNSDTRGRPHCHKKRKVLKLNIIGEADVLLCTSLRGISALSFVISKP